MQSQLTHSQSKPTQGEMANEGKTQHAGSDHAEQNEHQDPHGHMAANFRNRFWVSLGLTLPILLLSPMLQKLVGLREAIQFPGDLYVLFAFAIPLAAGALYAWGVLLSPAVGAGLMAASTVVVAVNARLLRLKKAQGEQGGAETSNESKQVRKPSQKTASTSI